MKTEFDIYQDLTSGEFYIIKDQNFSEKTLIDNDDENENILYQIVEREDLVNNLIDWISETNSSSDKEMMKEDLKYLMKLPDLYIFSSLSTNEYIAKSDSEKEFNDICADFIYFKKKGAIIK